MTTPRPIMNCNCGHHAWTTLTRGYVAIFDTEFAAAFGLWSWFAKPARRNVYVMRTQSFRIAGAQNALKIAMHQMVLPVGSSFLVDHINGNCLDNRRANLRVATRTLNAINQKPRIGALSKFRRVSRAGEKWRAAIGINGKVQYLGRFATEIEAAAAYDAAAIAAHGSEARTNFIQKRAA